MSCRSRAKQEWASEEGVGQERSVRRDEGTRVKAKACPGFLPTPGWCPTERTASACTVLSLAPRPNPHGTSPPDFAPQLCP